MRRAAGLAGLVAGLALFLGTGVAQAGVLNSGTLTLGTLPGQPVAYVPDACNYSDPTCLSGSTAQSAYLYPGSFFAGTTTFTGVPTLYTMRVQVGANGALFATPSAVQITAPITGSIVLGHTATPVLTIPLALGTDGTVTRTGFSGLLKVSVAGSGWHVGAVSTSGTFTSAGAVLPTHTIATTGSFNLNSFGVGTVKLVTLSHVKVSGLTSYDYVSPSSLTLFFVEESDAGVPLPPPPEPFNTPEPGALLLLTAAAAGLAGFGRHRRP